MRISPVFLNLYKNQNLVQSGTAVQSTPPPNAAKINSADSVNFSARIHEYFPKKFLKEILMCGLPCPVCGKKLIPLELLNESAVDALKLFDKNIHNMTDINKQIFFKMAELAPEHPTMNMQAILKMLHSKAEKNLIREQFLVLDELGFLRGQIPKNKVGELDGLLNETKSIIYQHGKMQNKKFKRKSAISEFDDFALSLSDDKVRLKIMNAIRRLPTSDNNTNAFIVKYSSRSPEEIGMKLYNKDFGTMEHIIPESSGGRIVIWECSEDNGARGNKPLNMQLSQKPEMFGYLQKHFDRLIQIYYEDAPTPYLATQKNLLKEYIFTAKNEFAIASRQVLNIDISALGDIPAFMINREIRRIRDMGCTQYLRNLYKLLQEK